MFQQCNDALDASDMLHARTRTRTTCCWRCLLLQKIQESEAAAAAQTPEVKRHAELRRAVLQLPHAFDLVRSIFGVQGPIVKPFAEVGRPTLMGHGWAGTMFAAANAHAAELACVTCRMHACMLECSDSCIHVVVHTAAGLPGCTCWLTRVPRGTGG